jgi:hypothetical protein
VAAPDELQKANEFIFTIGAKEVAGFGEPGMVALDLREGLPVVEVAATPADAALVLDLENPTYEFVVISMVSQSEIEARFFMSASMVGALKQRTIG